MTNDEKIYIAYGKCMYGFQLLEGMFEIFLMFLKLPNYDNGDALWADILKWRRGPLKRMIDLSGLPDEVLDLAIRVTRDRNHLAHQFLVECVVEVSNAPHELARILDELDDVRSRTYQLLARLATDTMSVLGEDDEAVANLINILGRSGAV